MPKTRKQRIGITALFVVATAVWALAKGGPLNALVFDSQPKPQWVVTVPLKATDNEWDRTFNRLCREGAPVWKGHFHEGDAVILEVQLRADK